MAIPARPEGKREPWSDLDPEAKRRRLLAAAERVFAREGPQAPVPTIAAEAEAGVGSVYRMFASKDEIVAALAHERLEWFTAEARAAVDADDPGAALEALLYSVVDRDARDKVLTGALYSAMAQPELVEARAVTVQALEQLLALVAEQGSFRRDLSTADIRIVLLGARGAEAEEPGTGRRLLELALSGLRR